MQGFVADCPDGRMDREKMRVMFKAIMPEVKLVKCFEITADIAGGRWRGFPGPIIQNI